MTTETITMILLSLGIMLGLAVIMGEIAQKLHQPAVLGEILAGVILGPTVLGYMFPEVQTMLFQSSDAHKIALESISSLSVVLFLLVAGIEVDLSTIWRQGKTGLSVALMGMIIPFCVGLATAYYLPQAFGMPQDQETMVFSLFLATAMSISALPVIAKTLMDMNLYSTDFGMITIGAAIFNDLLGWIIFSLILSMAVGTLHGGSIWLTVAGTLVFTGVMLTGGKYLINRSIPLLQAYTRWPGGVLSFSITIALLGAAFTEWIGIHAIFGSFIVGVALGNSPNLRQHTRGTIEQFISAAFAPLFFAGIGLKVDFTAHFDLWVTLWVLLIACVCKIAGGMLGGALGGMNRREAVAIGFALNSRGAMEIILGMLALQYGIISETLFVAIVIMAIVTSAMSGSMIKLVLAKQKKYRLSEAVSPKLYMELTASDKEGVIREMGKKAAEILKIPADLIINSVFQREGNSATGIGNRIAVPHARMEGIKQPVTLVGISRTGIDFNARDGKSAKIIFMILSHPDHSSGHSSILGDIARIFIRSGMTDKVMQCKNYTEFLGLLKTSVTEHSSHDA